jgi:hypothetical protein
MSHAKSKNEPRMNSTIAVDDALSKGDLAPHPMMPSILKFVVTKCPSRNPP